MFFRARSAGLRLPHLHFLPVDIAVKIVGKERRKADHHRNIPDVGSARQGPEDDEDEVVRRIGQRKIGASPEGQVDGQKAGGHRYGAGHDVGRVEVGQDEIEHRGHRRCAHAHPDGLFPADGIHLDLRLVAVVGVAHPGDQGKDRHRHGHPQIGDHLAVIGKGVGDPAVEQAEHHGQHLPEGVALGVEDQGRHPDQGSAEGHVAFPVKHTERNDDEPNRRSPEHFFVPGKIAGKPADRIFLCRHGSLLLSQKRSICVRIFQDLTMRKQMLPAFTTRWQFLIWR